MKDADRPEWEVMCDYCDEPAQCVGGDVIYPHRDDLAGKTFWFCEPCEAYVGCHPDTVRPLGRLANKELRAAKLAAHVVFDALWKRAVEKGRSKKDARSAAYAWLSRVTGIPAEECHIGMMDVERCTKVVEVCQQRPLPR